MSTNLVIPNAVRNLLLGPSEKQISRTARNDANADGLDRLRLYAAHLEGVAFVERWRYELMQELGAEVGETIFATGGGAKSVEWMRIRASVLKRRVVRPVITESAMGAAVVAASRTLFSNLTEASRAMVRREVEVEPLAHLVHAYEECYRSFRAECSRRGLGRAG